TLTNVSWSESLLLHSIPGSSDETHAPTSGSGRGQRRRGVLGLRLEKREGNDGRVGGGGGEGGPAGSASPALSGALGPASALIGGLTKSIPGLSQAQAILGAGSIFGL